MRAARTLSAPAQPAAWSDVVRQQGRPLADARARPGCGRRGTARPSPGGRARRRTRARRPGRAAGGPRARRAWSPGASSRRRRARGSVARSVWRAWPIRSRAWRSRAARASGVPEAGLQVDRGSAGRWIGSSPTRPPSSRRTAPPAARARRRPPGRGRERRRADQVARLQVPLADRQAVDERAVAALEVAQPRACDGFAGRLDHTVLARDRQVAQLEGARAAAAEGDRVRAELQDRAGQGTGDGDQA